MTLADARSAVASIIAGQALTWLILEWLARRQVRAWRRQRAERLAAELRRRPWQLYITVKTPGRPGVRAHRRARP